MRGPIATIRAIAAALMAPGCFDDHAPLVSADTMSALHAAEKTRPETEIGDGVWRITRCREDRSAHAVAGFWAIPARDCGF